jgi:hypothetical protein
MADNNKPAPGDKATGKVRHKASMEIPPQKPLKPNVSTTNSDKPKK